jgi:hypothetical protein
MNKKLDQIMTWFRKRQKTKKCKNCNHFDFGRCNRYPPVLITGKDLIRIGFKPGEIFAKICEEIRSKQYAQQINTVDEALEFASTRFKNIKEKI